MASTWTKGFDSHIVKKVKKVFDFVDKIIDIKIETKVKLPTPRGFKHTADKLTVYYKFNGREQYSVIFV